MNHTLHTTRFATIVAPMMLLLAVPAARAVSVAGDEPARPQVHLEMTILQLDLEAIEARDSSADAQEITYIYTLVEAGDLPLEQEDVWQRIIDYAKKRNEEDTDRHVMSRIARFQAEHPETNEPQWFYIVTATPPLQQDIRTQLAELGVLEGSELRRDGREFLGRWSRKLGEQSIGGLVFEPDGGCTVLGARALQLGIHPGESMPVFLFDSHDLIRAGRHSFPMVSGDTAVLDEGPFHIISAPAMLGLSGEMMSVTIGQSVSWLEPVEGEPGRLDVQHSDEFFEGVMLEIQPTVTAAGRVFIESFVLELTTVVGRESIPDIPIPGIGRPVIKTQSLELSLVLEEGQVAVMVLDTPDRDSRPILVLLHATVLDGAP